MQWSPFDEYDVVVDTLTLEEKYLFGFLESKGGNGVLGAMERPTEYRPCAGEEVVGVRRYGWDSEEQWMNDLLGAIGSTPVLVETYDDAIVGDGVELVYDASLLPKGTICKVVEVIPGGYVIEGERRNHKLKGKNEKEMKHIKVGSHMVKEFVPPVVEAEENVDSVDVPPMME
jgi:hypothetical protein